MSHRPDHPTGPDGPETRREPVAPGGSVLVIGPGAVGSWLGGTLAGVGYEVTLLGRSPRTGDDPRRLTVEEAGRERTVPVRRVADPGDVRPDVGLVVLAVRAFDVPAALATAVRWPEAPLMTAQNGIGAEAAARVARTSPLLAGSLTAAVELVPGGVRRLRSGGLGIAALPGDGSREAASLASRLADAWTAGGLRSRVFPDAAAMKWSKLLANLVANASSAILDMDPGDVYADTAGYRVERRQFREAVAVMRALSLAPVSLPGAQTTLLLRGLALPEPVGRPIVARAIAGARGGKSPSLRLHVLGGGGPPTEAAWLNGAVADAGERLGVPAPVNRALAALVDEVAADPSRRAWFRGRPDRLAATLGAA